MGSRDIDLAREQAFKISRLMEKTSIKVSVLFMDICDGNAYDAMVLGQVMYWHDLDKYDNPRARYEYGEYTWIVKTHEEWQKELHFKSANTVRDSFKKLESLGLIFKEVHKSPFHNGQVVSFVRWNFPKLYNELEKARLAASEQDISGTTSQVDPETTPQVDPIYTSTTSNTTPPYTPHAHKPATTPPQHPKNEGGGEKEKTTTEIVASTWFGIIDFSNLTRNERLNIESLMDEIDGIKKGITPQEIKSFVVWYKKKNPQLNLPGEKAIAKYLREWLQNKQPPRPAQSKRKSCGKCDKFGNVTIEGDDGMMYAVPCDCQKGMKHAS